MNILGTGATAKQQETFVSKEDVLQVEFQKDQVVEGTILEISDQISINFSGNVLKFSKDAVQDAREGEVRKFKIMDVSKQSIVLKEEKLSKKEELSRVLCTNVETTQVLFSAKEGNFAGKDVTLVKQIMKEIASKVTSKDYEELEKECTPMEEYQAGRLERAITRMKKNRSAREQNLKNQVEQLKQSEETIDKMATHSSAEQGMTVQISEFLAQENLPVTKENISAVQQALKQAESMVQLGESAISYLMQNELEPTIQNMYKAVHSGTKATTLISEGTWVLLKNSVEAAVMDAGFQVEPEIIENAKWLLSEKLPINKDTLLFQSNLQSLKKEEKQPTQEDLILAIVEALKAGKPANEALLFSKQSPASKEGRQETLLWIKELRDISDDAIKKASLEKWEEITIGHLKEAEKVPSKSKEQTGGFEELLIKRQLEEIRLKMTMDSASFIQSKGIDLDTEPLIKLVEQLRELEDQYYQNLADETGLSTETQKDLLRDTMERVAAVKAIPLYTLGQTILKPEQTLSLLQKEGENLAGKLAKSMESYETLMTEPRKDLGDSIQKAFQNVDDILKDLDLDLTETNQRVVRILAYNQMNIDLASITRMKGYDYRVTRLVEAMQPAMVASLIKSSKNPMELPLDELTKTLESFQEENKVQEESYSRFLVDMEANKQFTKEERDSYIGLYRLLYQVEKSDRAVLGFLAETGQELNLKNLLTAVRTLKKGKIDVALSQNMGSREAQTLKGEAIDDQILAAFRKEYYEELAKDTLQNLTPQTFIKAAEEGISIENSNFEQLKELQRQEKNIEKSKYTDMKLNNLQIAAQEEESVYRFLNQNGITESIQHILSAGDLFRGKNVFKELQSLEEKIENQAEKFPDFLESMDSKEALEQAYESFEEKSQKILQNAYQQEHLSAEDILKLKDLRNGIQFIRTLEQREHYELPISTPNGLTKVSLTVRRGQGENGKVSIRIPLENTNDIQMEFSVQEGKLKGLVLASGQDILDQVKSQEESMKHAVGELDLKVDTLYFALNTGDIKQFYLKQKQGQEEGTSAAHDQVRTGTLLRLAKYMIQNIMGGIIEHEN